jgi:hypothetical protein
VTFDCTAEVWFYLCLKYHTSTLLQLIMILERPDSTRRMYFCKVACPCCLPTTSFD